ncbi:hypothetical protein [Novosphingobium sp.]|uniref:hypothetical protein n=1 Tax=Novosphingobium sp. TaxID=1874826 RepID=UPI0031CDB63E
MSSSHFFGDAEAAETMSLSGHPQQIFSDPSNKQPTARVELAACTDVDAYTTHASIGFRN